MMTKYTVRYERDEDGLWVASVRGVKGVHTQGRSIAEARRRIREALSLAIGDDEAEAAELVDDVVMPSPIRAALKRLHALRKRLMEDQAQAQKDAAELAQVLTQTLHLSTRDVGELTGVSHQRVHQIVPKRKQAPTSKRARA
jgi:predicted RNase H-like HicB family nuclease